MLRRELQEETEVMSIRILPQTVRQLLEQIQISLLLQRIQEVELLQLVVTLSIKHVIHPLTVSPLVLLPLAHLIMRDQHAQLTAHQVQVRLVEQVAHHQVIRLHVLTHHLVLHQGDLILHQRQGAIALQAVVSAVQEEVVVWVVHHQVVEEEDQDKRS